MSGARDYVGKHTDRLVKHTYTLCLISDWL